MAMILTTRQMLRDFPHYRKFFSTTPTPQPFVSDLPDPRWWLYVQREEGGPWARAAMDTYAAAYSAAGKILNSAHDLSLTSRRRPFDPPHYPGQAGPIFWPLSHEWCGYCRRPVVYAWFKKHHVDPHSPYRKYLPPSHKKRCPICGIRQIVNDKWSNARLRN